MKDNKENCKVIKARDKQNKKKGYIIFTFFLLMFFFIIILGGAYIKKCLYYTQSIIDISDITIPTINLEKIETMSSLKREKYYSDEMGYDLQNYVHVNRLRKSAKEYEVKQTLYSKNELWPGHMDEYYRPSIKTCYYIFSKSFMQELYIKKMIQTYGIYIKLGYKYSDIADIRFDQLYIWEDTTHKNILAVSENRMMTVSYLGIEEVDKLISEVAAVFLQTPTQS